MRVPLLMVIYTLTALNVGLATRLWALSAPDVQGRWTRWTTVVALVLSVYVVAYEGDGDLTPLGAVSAGMLTLAAGMWVNAWR